MSNIYFSMTFWDVLKFSFQYLCAYLWTMASLSEIYEVLNPFFCVKCLMCVILQSLYYCSPSTVFLLSFNLCTTALLQSLYYCSLSIFVLLLSSNLCTTGPPQSMCYCSPSILPKRWYLMIVGSSTLQSISYKPLSVLLLLFYTILPSMYHYTAEFRELFISMIDI